VAAALQLSPELRVVEAGAQLEVDEMVDGEAEVAEVIYAA
jgi:hypothetical protein